MKPSERIKEIKKQMDTFLAPEPIAQAIMKYLDEQHEADERKQETQETQEER
jgi:hypothetical protein